MSSPTSHPNRPVQTDREYYTELWGNTPTRSRHSLIELKRRSGFVAALGAFALGVQLILGGLPSSGRQPSIEIGPAIGVGYGRSFTPSPDGHPDPNPATAPNVEGMAPQRRVSGTVGEFDPN